MEIPLDICSGDLILEAEFNLPDAAEGKVPGVVFCHPHPRYGGDMHNSVVTGVANRLVSDGFGVLRFNFRGVGCSGGEFGWGAGETDDAAAAVDFLSLREEIDPTRLGIAGYSFGAAVAIQVAMESSSIGAVVSIACPSPQVRAFSGLEILPAKLLIQGDTDHDFPIDQFRFLSKRFADPRQVEVVEGADHFFRGYESAVGVLVTEFLDSWLRR